MLPVRTLGLLLAITPLAACSGVIPESDEPAGPELVGSFTLDIDAAGNATVTMVDKRLATTVSVGATANKVNLTTVSKGSCGPSRYCVTMRLASGFAANDLRGTTVTLTKLSNAIAVSSANADPLPSHLVGTTATGDLGVWLYGNLEEQGTAGDSIDRTWEFNWLGGAISVSGKVFADVRPAAGLVETACTDGADNDGDRGFDCNDGDCATDPACPAEWCGTNGRDEDSDGDADCDDADCGNHALCAEVACADGQDNDGDGPADCADPDCDDDPICIPVESCDTVGDEDGDGDADCADSDCAATPACTELVCDDGTDSDDDGLTDCDDPDCTAASNCIDLAQALPAFQDPGPGDYYVTLNYNMGYGFNVRQGRNVTVTHLGGLFDGTSVVRLYNRDTGEVLAETTVTSTQTYAYAPIPPVVLAAGGKYSIAVRLLNTVGLEDFSASIKFPAGSPFLGGFSCKGYATDTEPCDGGPHDFSQFKEMWGLADFKYIEGPCLDPAGCDPALPEPALPRCHGGGAGDEHGMEGGYEFGVKRNTAVTALGGLFSGTGTVRLYDTVSYAILAEVTVTGDPDGYTYVDITPVQLTAGRRYAVAVALPDGGGQFCPLPGGEFFTPDSPFGNAIGCYRWGALEPADYPCKHFFSNDCDESQPETCYTIESNSAELYGLADFKYVLVP